MKLYTPVVPKQDSRSKLAPVENKEQRYGSVRGFKNDLVAHTPQAQRCPVCHALVLVGQSFGDHVYWCERPEIASHD